MHPLCFIRLPALGFWARGFCDFAPTSSVVRWPGKPWPSTICIFRWRNPGFDGPGPAFGVGRCVYAAGLPWPWVWRVTHERNRDYHTNLSIWADAIAKRPDNGAPMIIWAWRSSRPIVRRKLWILYGLATARLRILGAGPKPTWETFCSVWAGSMKPLTLQNTLRVNPNNWQAENNLGSALYHSGRSQEAIPHFLQAAKLNPVPHD